VRAWPEPVERVAAFVRASGADARLEEFSEATRTASAAARALGCEPAQIVKSILFVCDGAFVLALVPGDRRADAAKVATAAGAAGARVGRPDEVLPATGFEPGGVAPFPSGAARVFVDAELLQLETVWVGGGSPRHLAGLSPHDLVRLAQAVPADLAEA